jgi:cytochrome c oxidase subunit 4
MAQPTPERLTKQLEHPERVAGNVGHAGSGTEPENGPHDEDHGDDHTHHVPMSSYYMVFGLLMVLLFITVGAWYVDQHLFSLGRFSTPVAMAIAVAKAAAIVLIFMHVKFSSRLVQIFACTGIIFVGVMFLLTFNDYGTRGWTPIPGQDPGNGQPTLVNR